MLFGLLVATGIGEALTLERSDVDWNQGALLRGGGIGLPLRADRGSERLSCSLHQNQDSQRRPTSMNGEHSFAPTGSPYSSTRARCIKLP